MSNKSIKIDGDVSGIKKAINSVTESIGKIGQKKIDIGLDSKKLKEAKADLNFIYDNYKKIGKEAINLQKQIDNAFSSNAVKKYKNELKELQRQKKDYQREEKNIRREISDLEKKSGDGSTGGGGKGGSGGSGFGGIFTGSFLADAAMKAVTWAITGAMQAAESRIKLRGLGLNTNSLNSLEATGVKNGYAPEESRQQAIGLLRETGGIKSLSEMQRFSKGSGADPFEVIGMMGGLRNSGMGEKQSIKMLKDTFSEAVAAGFDTSRALDVLGIISSNTDAMAKNGGAGAEGIKALMISLMRGSSFFTQNADRGMNAISGFDKLFTGGGPASTIGYMALKKLHPEWGINKLMFERSRGLLDAPDVGSDSSTERLKSAIGVGFNLYKPGADIKAGGGSGQVSEEDILGLSNSLSPSLGLKPTMIAAAIDAYLNKSGVDQEGVFKEVLDSQKDLGSRTLEVLQSSDQHLKDIGNTISQIQEDVGEILMEMVGILHPFKDNPLSWDNVSKNFNNLLKNNVINNSVIKSDGSKTNTGASYDTSYNLSPLLTKFDLSKTGENKADKYDKIIGEAANKYGLPPNIIKAIMMHESNFNPNATSTAGAQGLMQLLPSTARMLGVSDSLDPEQNTFGGAKYFRQMLDKYNGNYQLALAAYNAGPGRVDKAGGIPNIPETKDYVAKVTQNYNKLNEISVASPQQEMSNISNLSSSTSLNDYMRQAAIVWTETLKKQKEEELKTKPILNSNVSDNATLNKTVGQ